MSQTEIRNVLKAIENDEAHYPTVNDPIPPTLDPTEPNLMHFARRLHTESHCDGCGQPFTQRIVTLLTDKSGSEQAVAHINADCIHRAIVRYGVDRL